MTRNKIVTVVGILAVVSLLVAALGFYRVFSYVAGALIVGVLPIAAIERGSRELDLAPYTGLIAGLAVLFAVGLSGIWLLWEPGMTSYSYVFGLPTPTFVYALFIWFLPLLAPVYYAVAIFRRTASEETVTDVMNDARRAQQNQNLPLAPAGSPDRAESDGGTNR